MIPGALARRYAKALVELAETPVQRDRFAKDLDAFADLAFTKDTAGFPVVSTLVTKRFSLEERGKLVAALSQRVAADPLLQKFLQYVLRRGRMDGIGQIARAYRRLADEAAGRVQATLTSAQPLPPLAVSKLTASLNQATGLKVDVRTEVDPELIGGVVAQVGSYVVDGSVRTSLDNLKRSLRAN